MQHTDTQVWWATEVGIAFGKLEEGFETAMKDYYKVQVNNLNDLITRLQGKLTKGHRVMLQTVCTVDVHSRDVVGNLIKEKADNPDAFIWQSQLRHSWDDDENHCRIAICDARFWCDPLLLHFCVSKPPGGDCFLWDIIKDMLRWRTI